MKYTKEEIEQELFTLLNTLLEGGNQEGSIKNLVYDPETRTCTVTMTVYIFGEDQYIGFQSY